MSRNWYSQAKRTTFIIDSQVRSLRQSHLVKDFLGGRRFGTLWTIHTNMSAYSAHDTLPVSTTVGRELADLSTRLTALPTSTRQQLINLGYAQADGAVRSYLEPTLDAPSSWPFPTNALG